MIPKKKLQDKNFRKTFKLALNELKTLMLENGIDAMQKLFLSKQLDRVRDFKIKDSEDNTASVELNIIKPDTNKWGQKNLHSVLNEKNEKIQELINKIESYKNENLRIEEDRKRIKIEKEETEAFKKVLEEKSKLIVNYKIEIANLKTELAEYKLILSSKEESLENIKELNKKLVEFSKSNKNTPDTSSFHLNNTVNAILETNNHNQSDDKASFKIEIDCLKETIINKDNKISNLEMLLNNALFRLDHISKYDVEEGDRDLYEELNNISTAFDMSNTANSELEKQITQLNSKNSEISSENLVLKNKIKILEDSKMFVEKEKRRLDDLKDSLLKEARIIQEEAIIKEKDIFDKDKKIQEYRGLIINLQGNEKIMEKEILGLKNCYKILQEELKLLKGNFYKIETENEDLVMKNKLLGSNQGDIGVLETVEKYKKVLCCSLCSNNIKNCVLSKCMHTFCETCIDARFKSRQRSCPICQTDFTMANVKKLYL